MLLLVVTLTSSLSALLLWLEYVFVFLQARDLKERFLLGSLFGRPICPFFDYTLNNGRRTPWLHF